MQVVQVGEEGLFLGQGGWVGGVGWLLVLGFLLGLVLFCFKHEFFGCLLVVYQKCTFYMIQSNKLTNHAQRAFPLLQHLLTFIKPAQLLINLAIIKHPFPLALLHLLPSPKDPLQTLLNLAPNQMDLFLFQQKLPTLTDKMFI